VKKSRIKKKSSIRNIRGGGEFTCGGTVHNSEKKKEEIPYQEGLYNHSTPPMMEIPLKKDLIAEKKPSGFHHRRREKGGLKQKKK